MTPDPASFGNILAAFDPDRSKIAQLAANLAAIRDEISNLRVQEGAAAEIEADRFQPNAVETRAEMRKILREVRAELGTAKDRAVAAERDLKAAMSAHLSKLRRALRPERAKTVEGITEAFELLLKHWKVLDEI